MIRSGQIEFNESTYYVFDIPFGYLSAVKEGDSVTMGEPLIVQDKKKETVFVECFGDLVVKKDAIVRPGDILCKKSGVLKSESIKSEVDGTIISINDNVIEIKVYDPESSISDLQTQSPFDSKIEKIEQGKILISFSSVQLNLLAAKGHSAIGNLLYKDEADLSKKTKDNSGIEGSILITKFGSFDIYPKVSALGSLGLIVNSIDFDIYDKTSVLEVPIGVITGFGDLIEDETLVKWFK